MYSLFIFYFSLFCSYIYATASFFMPMLYTIIQSYASLSLSIFLTKSYLFITFSLPFYSLFQGLIRCTILIVSSHFLSFLSFHYILSSFLFYWHLTLSDPKGCTGLSPYRYYLYSIQSWYSSISKRPTYTMFLSFDLI